jgi:hypothetical protein
LRQIGFWQFAAAKSRQDENIDQLALKCRRLVFIQFKREIETDPKFEISGAAHLDDVGSGLLI